MDRAAENHYTTTALEQLKAMPWPAAPVCRLYLWATVPLLPQMLDLMTAQGFAYSSHIVWVKATLDGTKIKTSTGYETFNAHELLLIGDNSPDVPSPAPGQQPVSVIFAPHGAHSEKPEVFAEMIAQAFPQVPKVEPFARRPRPGWAVWGDEVIEEEEEAVA